MVLPIIDPHKLQIHYYFNDESHNMDAHVRHKCEGALLSIVKQISGILEIELKVETEPYQKGGLTEYYDILVSNLNSPLAGAFAVYVLNIIKDVLTHHLKSDKELTNLQKKELKLKIDKLKAENSKGEETPALSADEVEHSVLLINANPSVKKQKSIFYYELFKYPKVKKVEASILRKVDNEQVSSVEVERNSFKDFIIETEKLDPLVDENAVIDIISPVLKKEKGKYPWKGLYNGVPIDFYMKDKKFQKDVFDGRASFKSGSLINCVLEKHRKMDEEGKIYLTGYSVLTVLSKYEGDLFIETAQGIKYRNNKTKNESQLELFNKST
jgi:hypothetical protein